LFIYKKLNKIGGETLQTEGNYVLTITATKENRNIQIQRVCKTENELEDEIIKISKIIEKADLTPTTTLGVPPSITYI